MYLCLYVHYTYKHTIVGLFLLAIDKLEENIDTYTCLIQIRILHIFVEEFAENTGGFWVFGKFPWREDVTDCQTFINKVSYFIIIDRNC